MNDKIEHEVIANHISSLSLICAANPYKILDLLSGYLFDEKELDIIHRILIYRKDYDDTIPERMRTIL